MDEGVEDGEGGVDLGGALLEAGQDVTAGVGGDGEQVTELQTLVGENAGGVVAAGVDVDAAGAGDVAEGTQIARLPRVTTAVPVKRSATSELPRASWTMSIHGDSNSSATTPGSRRATCTARPPPEESPASAAARVCAAAHRYAVTASSICAG